MKYEVVIGLEIHAELSTESKLFCSCKNDPFGARTPNTYICPICLGLPGTLPVMNRAAVESTVLVGLALGCTIGHRVNSEQGKVNSESASSPFTVHRSLMSKWDRKNYFYPDLPKAYQISQSDLPICHEGALEIGLDGSKIAITRIHLEEDTAKLIHPANSGQALIDFNRAGVPLLELVTEPEIRSGEEAADFAKYYQLVLRMLGVADADMEKGGMRVEVNISLRDKPKTESQKSKFGTKVEIKNLNSFKIVKQAIEYEIGRQAELLSKGEEVVQETRGWDEAEQRTVSQRVKETAADYRYFPEPDLPPVTFFESGVKSKIQKIENRGIDLAVLRSRLPELPLQIWNRWAKEWAIPDHVSWRLTADVEKTQFVDQALAMLEKTLDLPDARRRTSGRKVADWVVNGLVGPETPTDLLAKLAVRVAEGTLTHETAKSILDEYRSTGADLGAMIEAQSETTETVDLGAIIDAILVQFPQGAADYRAGKQAAFGYLVGQVMKETKGRIEPATIQSELRKKLDS